MIRPVPHIAAAFALACLSACATGGPATSYVAPSLTGQGDAQALAGGIASVAVTALPPGSGSVFLEPPPKDQADNGVTPALAAALRLNGLTVADKPDGAHRLRYWLTPLDTGDLVRVAIDGTPRAARFFARSGGSLQPVGPVTLAGAQ